MAIGRQTRFPSLSLGIKRGTGFGGYYDQTLSWSPSGTPIPSENRPHVLFDQLFRQETDESLNAREAEFVRRVHEAKAFGEQVLERLSDQLIGCRAQQLTAGGTGRPHAMVRSGDDASGLSGRCGGHGSAAYRHPRGVDVLADDRQQDHDERRHDRRGLLREQRSRSAHPFRRGLGRGLRELRLRQAGGE